MSRTLETLTVYIDSQDPNNEGWAFRAEFNDGHQESGPVDMDLDDQSGQALDELRMLVDVHGGSWDEGSWKYCENESGFYVWEA
jgi:hypothetical protein